MGMGFHSNIILALDGTVAERWFYFPCIGLLGMLGLLLDEIPLSRFSVVASMGVLFILGARSYERSADWPDNYTLCLHDLQILPNSYDLHNNLGVELFRRGQIDSAKKEFERSTELAPQWDINWSNLGAAYGRLGNFKRAEESYLLAMTHGGYFLAYENYASILVAEGRKDEARRFIAEKALPLFPGSEPLKSLYISLVQGVSP